MRKFILISYILLTTPSKIIAQDDELKYFKEIKSKVEKLKLDYKVSEFNSITITYKFSDRKQILAIDSRPLEIDGVVYLKVSSPSILYEKKEDIDNKFLFNLLRMNHDSKVGFWQVNGDSGPYFVEFAANIPIKSKSKDLLSLIKYIALNADDMEAYTMGDDEF